MKARLDLAVKKNCDDVEPDNIKAYKEDTNFPKFPLLLENNMGKIKKSDLNQSDKIQSIVTPINYDQEKGGCHRGR